MDPAAPRSPRPLPIAPMAQPGLRKLPLLAEAREVDRTWKPIYVVWEITLRCDLACTHCGSRAGKARPDEISTAEALDLVDQMAAMGTQEVTLIGGEAYLHQDWDKIVRRIRSHGMNVSMTSGGRGIDAEMAQRMADAGLMSVSISIDGLQATHDRLRGVKGSYASALAAMGHLRDAGVRITANTQVCRQNLFEIEELFEVMADVGIRAWQVQITVAMGRAADDPELLLEPYQMLEVMPMIKRLKERGLQRKVRLWPGNNIGYFGPYEHILRQELPRGHMHACGAGRTTMGIEANGAIKGCPSLSSMEYTGGNIRDASLVDIWQRTEPLRFTRDRTVDDLWGFCRDCYYGATCLAGCNWTTSTLLGKPGNNPFCHHRALELLRQGKRERVVKVKDAPNQPFDHGEYAIVVEDWPDSERAVAMEIAESGEGFLRPSPSDAHRR